MRDIVLLIIHLAVTAAKLLGPGGARAIVAENLLLKHELTVLCLPLKRAPNLLTLDRFLFGFGSLFLSGKRIHKLAIVLQPSTLLKFHDALVRQKYRRLFS
jgi:putative transposase